jgi:hypothetical protein
MIARGSSIKPMFEVVVGFWGVWGGGFKKRYYMN